MIDQADKLRNIVNQNKKNHHIKIYSVVSGKGGVGKTNFSINLGILLQKMGKKVLIIDADIGMTNANIMLGIDTPLNLGEFFKGGCSLEEIISQGPEGLGLISGGSDMFLMEHLDIYEQQEIVNSLEELDKYDIIIIDNGAGISKHSLTFSTFAHEMILVTTPEPTALMDAYRILKITSAYKLKNKVKVVINQVPDKKQGDLAYDKLLITSQQFLNLEIENLGYIFNDIRVGKAIMEQIPLVISYPKSLASENLREISKNILEDRSFNQAISSFKQFGNRLIRFFG